jgi:hypothetical protein
LSRHHELRKHDLLLYSDVCVTAGPLRGGQLAENLVRTAQQLMIHGVTVTFSPFDNPGKRARGRELETLNQL